MKRDIELIRNIMLAIDKDPQMIDSDNFNLDGVNRDTIIHHLEILLQAGWLHGVEIGTKYDISWVNVRPTWKGHEFIEVARNSDLWQQLRKRVEKENLSLPMEVLQELMVALLKKRVASG